MMPGGFNPNIHHMEGETDQSVPQYDARLL